MDQMDKIIEKKTGKRWYALALLALFVVLAATSMTHNSATSDEVAHIPAGYSYWNYFDYKINPEHPPLIKLWATLPLLFLQPHLPAAEYWERGDQWEFGRQFLYWSGNDADKIYFWTRLMIVLIGVLLGWYVYKWAAELYGWKAGLLALLLYVLDPNIITHSTIVQTDISISAGIFILTYYFWKYTQQKEISWHWKQIAVLGVLVGICFAVKYTGIYVVGFLLILYFVHLALDWYDHNEHKHHAEDLKTEEATSSEQKKDDQEDDFFAKCNGFYHALLTEKGQKKLIPAGIAFAKILLIGVIVLAATYGFVNFNWYFVGFNNVALHSTEGHPAYLLGMNSQTGWWYYFIVAFLVKTPIATILLIAASFFVFFKTAAAKTNTRLKNELFLLIPAVLYFIIFMLNGINIGLRHILPVYPFLFVFTGSLFTVDWKIFGEKISLYMKYAPYMLGVLLGWLIVANIMIYPYYIAYFNEFTGGPSHGYEYLLDSNLDWGQGLKDTAVWLSDHGYLNQTIRMTYFGSEDPVYRGIHSINTACAPTPGIVVISVDRLYDFMGNQKGCGEWLKNYQPVAIIDYSIWIYDIEDPTVIENYTQCKQDCSKGCLDNGQVYGDSVYTSKCICICQDATNSDLGIL